MGSSLEISIILLDGLGSQGGWIYKKLLAADLFGVVFLKKWGMIT